MTAPSELAGVTAVVLTHMRPRLAGDVTRALLEVEGLPPDQVVVVVNDVGGLDDPARVVGSDAAAADELGTGRGFSGGALEAFSDPATSWAYLCEDDIGLFSLPGPRLVSILARLRALPPSSVPVGAVAAYGRRFVGHGGHTVNVVPPSGSPEDLVPIDVSCWGATPVSRAVVDAGVLPDPEWFFGYEDFDFFCRLRAAGFSVLVDARAAAQVADEQTTAGRAKVLRARRPTDADEAWRAYYVARNYFALARRHGTWRWILWHLAYSARRLQLAHGREERLAILHGLWDGARGRLGDNPALPASPR